MDSFNNRRDHLNRIRWVLIWRRLTSQISYKDRVEFGELLWGARETIMITTYFDPNFIGPILPPKHLPLEQKKAVVAAILSQSVVRKHVTENKSE